MCQFVNLLQLANRDLRIDLRRSKISMPEHCLDVPNVCAVLEH